MGEGRRRKPPQKSVIGILTDDIPISYRVRGAIMLVVILPARKFSVGSR